MFYLFQDNHHININIAFSSLQASNNRTLFNVSSALDGLDKSKFEATTMGGTKLCSRRLLQEIIYCVGGVSVFFPLLIHFDDAVVQNGESAASDQLAGQVIELVASVLDGNIANQQQMHLLSGFSILGFLFQSVSPQLLNSKTLSASKYMFTVLKTSSELSLSLSLSHLPICLEEVISVAYLLFQACQRFY